LTACSVPDIGDDQTIRELFGAEKFWKDLPC